MRELKQPVPLGGQSVAARASSGIAVADPTGTGPAELLRRADIAMYAARRARIGDWRLYDDSLVTAGSAPGR